jgi:predicted nucleotidyltransferase component of viral defense system
LQWSAQRTLLTIGIDRIKELVVIAMFSDDELMDRLVLKGGNALDIIHQVSVRASIDVDFSMSDDFRPERLGVTFGRGSNVRTSRLFKTWGLWSST